MNENDINMVFDHICEKLGTASEAMTSELTRYSIILNSVDLAVSMVILVVCVGSIRWAWKGVNDIQRNGDIDFIVLLMAAVVGAISLVVIIISAHCLFGWIISPKAATFVYIANLLGGS